MTTTIQAIPTEYKGVRYDSQLEARWAVFFDAMGIPFKTGGRESFLAVSPTKSQHKHYTPDFVLQDSNLAVEVKGTMSNVPRSLLAHYLYYAASRPEGLLFLFPIPTPRPLSGERTKIRYKTLWHPLIDTTPSLNPEVRLRGIRTIKGKRVAFLQGECRYGPEQVVLPTLGHVRNFLESFEREPRFDEDLAPDNVVDAYFRARQYDFREGK